MHIKVTFILYYNLLKCVADCLKSNVCTLVKKILYCSKMLSSELPVTHNLFAGGSCLDVYGYQLIRVVVAEGWVHCDNFLKDDNSVVCCTN